VTEEIWGRLKTALGELAQPISTRHAPDWEPALIIANWPEPSPESPWEARAISDFSLIMDLVRSIRNLRSEKNIDPKIKIPAILVGGDYSNVLQQQRETIASLARLDAKKLTINQDLPGKPEGYIALVVGPIEAYLLLAEIVDPAEQRMRLEKEYAEAAGQVERLEKLLGADHSQNGHRSR